jgi:hypothetical protein
LGEQTDERGTTNDESDRTHERFRDEVRNDADSAITERAS